MTELMVRLALWMAVLLFPAAMAAQTLKGEVRDASTGDPVVGATVSQDSSVVAVSDVDGLFSVTYDPKRPALALTVSALGFDDLTRTFDPQALPARPVVFALQPATNRLGLAVVSAGKFEQDVSELTVSMEVLQPGLIEGKNTLNMDEALQQTPGVVIVDSEPQIRGGSGYSFGAGSRVQVLVDDLPLLSGDAGRPIWGFLPVENVEQVEVIKGASSVLYGSAALSGVINVRTARPTDTPTTRIQTYHGFYSDPPNTEAKYWDNTHMLSGVNAFHARKIGRLDLVMGLSLLGNDGYKGPILDTSGALPSGGYNPFEVNTYDGENRARINVNTRYTSSKIPGLSFGINTNWLKGESISTLIWENDSTGIFGTYTGAATRTKQVVGTVDPFVEYLSPNGTRHALRGRWQSLDNDNDNNQGNFSDVYYGSYQIQRGLGEVMLTAGVVGQYTDARGQLFTGGNPDGNNTASNTAGFLQADWKHGLWNISGGMRYESFTINGEQEGRPVFRAGANYQAAEATFLRASFGQGYRFPSIAEKFIQTAVGVGIYPNPDLRSETSYNAEVGLKQGFQIGEFKGYADVALFYQRFENFIEFTFNQWGVPLVDDLFGFGFKSVNTADAEVAGVDASILGTGTIGKVELTALAGYTYTRPRALYPDSVYAGEDLSYSSTSSFTENNLLKYRMPHVVRADLQANYQSFEVGVSYRFNSYIQNVDQAFFDIEDFNLPGVSSWQADRASGGDSVVDLRVGYHVADQHKVSLVVNNLFNRLYAIRPLAIESTRQVVLQYLIVL